MGLSLYGKWDVVSKDSGRLLLQLYSDYSLALRSPALLGSGPTLVLDQ